MLATAGCGDSPMATQNGRLSILLTDAPGDFAKAVVTISQIYLQGEGGRVVLMDTPVTTDLLTLANSTAELVRNREVPTGSYQDLRFVVTGGYVEVENSGGGTSIYASSPDYAGLPAGAQVDGTLQMPSFAQSGLKVKLPGDGPITVSAEQTILVDFDVSRSFGRQAGNSGRWVMSPVLEATRFEATGSVVARVALASPAPALPSVSGQPLTLGNLTAVLTNAAGSQETVAPHRRERRRHVRGALPLPRAGQLPARPGRPGRRVADHRRDAPVVVPVTSNGETAAAFTLTGATYAAPAAP
jgi:hypothetical protein